MASDLEELELQEVSHHLVCLLRINALKEKCMFLILDQLSSPNQSILITVSICMGGQSTRHYTKHFTCAISLESKSSFTMRTLRYSLVII